MISHQLSVAATCDRVLMDKGKIVQEGTHKDLLEVNGLYKKLWDRELATKLLRAKSNFFLIMDKFKLCLNS